MAGFLGADTEALRVLGRAVDGGAERLEQLTAQLDGIVGGIDADYARALVGRVGADRVPDWVRELAAGE